MRNFVAPAALALAAALLAWPAAPDALAMGNRVTATPEPPGDVQPAATIPDMEEVAGHLIHLGARLTFSTPRGERKESLTCPKTTI